MATEKPRYCITVDDELLKEIDDFRFENRYNSRSQATLELIRLGLKVLKQQNEPCNEQVLPLKCIANEEHELLTKYQALPENGKELIRGALGIEAAKKPDEKNS